MQRKLTTILATDVVGYSRLMGEDEAGTLDALKTPLRPQSGAIRRAHDQAYG